MIGYRRSPGIRAMRILTACLCLGAGSAWAQADPAPLTIREDPALSQRLAAIAADLGLDGDFDVGEDGIEQISLAVIDMSGDTARIGGVNPDNFIYPASVYKMYVAAEVLRQVREGRYRLDSLLVVRAPNDVDRSREIGGDPRPLLQDGDTVTVWYLLDLMITRSDNSAANCLIDLATRPRIDSLMHAHGWRGSEVTRKFLSRRFEDPGYADVRGTETCARHAAEFLYRIATHTLVDPWVSMRMRVLLGGQLDDTKLATGLPPGAMFYHKTGWWSFWTHDVGIVDDGTTRYVMAVFLPVPEAAARPLFTELAKRVHGVMGRR